MILPRTRPENANKDVREVAAWPNSTARKTDDSAASPAKAAGDDRHDAAEV